MVRHGISRILLGPFPDLAIGEADTAEQGLHRFKAEAWDLVILDLGLPDVSGLDVIREMLRVRPKARIIIVSVHPPHHFAHRALAAGALGYLQKSVAPKELVKAVTEVMAGRPYVPQAAGDPAAKGHSARGLPHEALSDREYQVLRMLGTGKTVSEIAAELALSVKTVSTYRARVLEKMQLRTTAELMHYVIDHGLVP